MVRLYLGVGIGFVSLILIACGGAEEAQPTRTPTAEVQAPAPTATAAPTATPEPAVLTLAFIRDGDIWLVDAAGSNERRITQFGGTDRKVVDFQWLANGREIAYREFSPTTATSALVSLDGQVLWDVDGGATTLWSPDGQLVAIQSGKGFTRIEDREGRSVWPGNDAVGSGSWSPDGSHFAIVEGDEIVVVSRDGISVSRLDVGPPLDVSSKLGGCNGTEFGPGTRVFGRPVFTADSGKVLVVVGCSILMGATGNIGGAIYEASLDGLVNRLHSAEGTGVVSLPTPILSPDASRVALISRWNLSGCESEESLSIFDLHRGNQQELTPEEISKAVQAIADASTEGRTATITMSGLAWSPAGDAVVATFAAKDLCGEGATRLEAAAVYLLRIDGVADEKIAEGFSETVSWSPSGDLIAYAMGEPDAPQIHVFDLVTREVTDLGPGEAPAWGPLPPEVVSLPWEGAVTDNRRIRNEANTASDTVGTLSKGTKVRVYGEAEGEEAEPGSGNRIWYRVIGGWVYSAFVER